MFAAAAVGDNSSHHSPIYSVIPAAAGANLVFRALLLAK